MGHGDRISDLQSRLDHLPPELEKLYEKILVSLDPFYLEHASQYFAIVRVSKGPPLILAFLFADDERPPEFVLDQPVRPLSNEDLSIRLDIIQRRLVSRCKGLLEIAKNLDNFGSDRDHGYKTVQYLHRTVKDYIEDENVQALLSSYLKSPFDPHLKLCAGNLASLKVVEEERLLTDVITRCVDACLYSAARVLPENEARIIHMLDELDKTGNILAKKTAENRYLVSQVPFEMQKLLQSGLWALSSPPSFCHRNVFSLGRSFGRTFLSLCVDNAILAYVRARASHGCLVQKPSSTSYITANNEPAIGVAYIVWPLLMDAVCTTTPNAEMIKCLLDFGADPNYLVFDKSPWITAITKSLSSRRLKKALKILHSKLPSELWRPGRNVILPILNELDEPWKTIVPLMAKRGAQVTGSVLDSAGLKEIRGEEAALIRYSLVTDLQKILAEELTKSTWSWPWKYAS